MATVRTINRVPQIYVDRSRDFQLLCNLFDLVNNGVKFDIDTITTVNDTSRCRETMLPLLQHKLGFFTDIKITDNILRSILKVFPYIVRYKGSKKAVIDCINLFMYVNQSQGKFYTNITNYEGLTGEYNIKCSITSDIIRNVDILDALLYYVIPSGYFVTYQLQVGAPGISIYINSKSEVDYDKASYVVNKQDDNTTENFTDNIFVMPIIEDGEVEST